MMNEFSFSTESVSSIESVTLAESLDEVQAKKTALLFLCKINADSKEVERFLMRYPEALLFEGADVEEGAQSLIEAQVRRCKCFVSVCNANRKRVLLLLRRGFEYYRGVLFTQSLEEDWFFRKVSGGQHWEFYAEQLKMLEKDLREINERETKTKKRIDKTRVEVKEYRRQLESASRQDNIGRTPLTLLKCQRPTNKFENRSQLENKLGAATMGILSLEKEYDLLAQERIAAKQLQHALLKTTFAGCERHVCDATRREFE
jgi:hypothetical protein